MATKKKKAKKTTKRSTKNVARKSARKAAPRRAKTQARKPARAAARKAGSAKSAKPATRKVAKHAKPAKRAKPAMTAKHAKTATQAKTAKSATPTRAAKTGAPAKKATRAASAKPLRREDHAGHFDPRYAADLRARSDREGRGPDSFIDRPRTTDSLVEELGEEYVATATSGEYEAEDAQNQEVAEEVGGPFVQTTGDQEFAKGTDASNPKGATREPFPRT